MSYMNRGYTFSSMVAKDILVMSEPFAFGFVHEADSCLVCFISETKFNANGKSTYHGDESQEKACRPRPKR